MSLQIPVVPFKTSASIAYFVRTDGSDNNDGSGNTAATAFLTIKKALDMIPQICNHIIQIFIAPGTYDERIIINGFSGSGEIRINPGQSAVSTTYNVQNVRVYNCSIPVSINGIYASTIAMNAFEAYNSVNVEFKYCYAAGVTSTYHGVYANSSNVYMYTCTINMKGYAVYAGQNSSVLVWSCTGSGNDIGLYAGEGGQISTTGTVPTGTMATATGNSGNIFSGVINPWGDNTHNKRTGIGCSANGGQVIANATWVKVTSAFNAINYDYLGGEMSSSGTFTAKQTGIYQITAAVSFDTVTNGATAQLRFARNGTLDQIIGTQTISSSGNTTVCGTINTDVYAGTTIDIYVFQNFGFSATTSNNGYYCYLKIVRIS